MRPLLKPKISAIADVAIIVAAIAIAAQSVVWVLHQSQVSANRATRGAAAARRAASAAQRQDYKAGDHLPVNPKLQLTQSDKTLVLFIRSTCRYCTASIPFYRKLLQERSDKRAVRIVAVSHESQDTLDRYLRDNQLTPDASVSLPASEFGRFRITGTPTLVLVDKNGSVQQVWIGQLHEPQQAEVLKAIARAKTTQS